MNIDKWLSRFIEDAMNLDKNFEPSFPYILGRREYGTIAFINNTSVHSSGEVPEFYPADLASTLGHSTTCSHFFFTVVNSD